MKNIISYFAVLLSLLSIIFLFLPWVQLTLSGNALGFSASSNISSFKGIFLPGGFLGLITSITGGILAFKKMKWTFIAGIINTLTGIGWYGHNISFEGKIGGLELDLSIHNGLVLFTVCSAFFLIITTFFIKNHQESKSY